MSHFHETSSILTEVSNQNSVLNNNKDEPNYQALAKIGLTKMAVDCYAVLVRQTGSTTQELSRKLSKPYRSIQRCLNDLQAKGFIRKIYTGYRPSKYNARLLHEAMTEYSLWQKQQIGQLINAQKIQQYEKELAKLKR